MPSILLKVLGYLPTLIAVIDAVTKLVDALKSKAEALKKNQQTSVEDRAIAKNKNKLIEVARSFFDAKAQAQASQAELENFSDKLLLAVEAVFVAVEAFVPLLR